MPDDVSAFTGLRPEHPTSLFGMYTAKGPRVPIYTAKGPRVPMFVLRPDQPLETTYNEATPYKGEPYGANAIIDEYMYHLNTFTGIYMTIKLKGD